MKSLLNCASGGPGFRCNILDHFGFGQNFVTKKTVSWVDTNGGFLFAIDFLGCFFLLFGTQIFGVSLVGLQ